MLRKLMKYEFRAAGRLMWPLYLAVLGTSLMLGITLRVTSNGTHVEGTSIVGDNLGILSAILLFIFIGVCMATFVMTIVLVIQSFYKNLLGNQGYLMFALPVKTSTHVWNKILTGTIWIVLGGIVALLAFLIMLCAIAGPIEMIQGFGKWIASIPANEHLDELGLFFEWILIVICGLAVGVSKIYAAISIGQLMENHRLMVSILAYLGFGAVETFLANIIGIPVLSTVSFGSAMGAQHFALIIWAVVLIQCAIYYVITWQLLDKKLNLQ